MGGHCASYVSICHTSIFKQVELLNLSAMAGRIQKRIIRAQVSWLTSKEHKKRSRSTQLLSEGILLVGVKSNWEASFEYLLLIYLHNNCKEKKKKSHSGKWMHYWHINKFLDYVQNYHLKKISYIIMQQITLHNCQAISNNAIKLHHGLLIDGFLDGKIILK